MKPEVILTVKQAKDCISEWANRLNLTDWSFGLYYTKSDDPAIPKVEGAFGVRAWCQPDYYNKTATIGLVLPSKEERERDKLRPWDMEETIVHELLHIPLALASCDFNDGYGKMEQHQIVALEQQVNALANAFVKLKRTPK